ncbi:hypothetical protein EDD25_2807 [Cryobacterium psychrophilum]|nr:hypothetical protein EDD25_2807 [Cryobacterium psychrophilum]
MIVSTDLTGVDELLAQRIIAVAVSIAPCLDSLPDGSGRSSAVAILRGIAADVADRGSRMVKSQRMGPASVEYTSTDSWFSADDRSALRSLCGAVAQPGMPVGQFPKSGLVNRLWPE